MRHVFGMLLLAALAWVLPLGGPVARADSGFARARNSVYAKLAYTHFRSNRFYDLDGGLNDTGDHLRLQSMVLYAELGLLDELDIFLNWPAFRVSAFSGTSTVRGTGDLQLGLKYGHSRNRHHIAGIVAPEFPTGDPDAMVFRTTTLASGETRRVGTGLPTGDGELNVWTKLAYSISLHEVGSWVNLDFGVNWRSEGFAHQIGYGAEFGHFLLDRVYLQARVRGQYVPSSDLQTDTGFIFGEGTEFLSIGAGLAVPLPRTPIALTFDWDQIVALQRNVYAGPLFVVGVSFECGPRSSPEARACE